MALAKKGSRTITVDGRPFVCVIVALVGIAAGSVCLANPVWIDKQSIYLVGEHLTIALSEDEGVVDGQFTFVAGEDPIREARGEKNTVYVPVMVPKE